MVAPKAKQNAPVTCQYYIQHNYARKGTNIPRCPKTTHENVFPMINSRIQERINSKPPKRIKVPLSLVSKFLKC
jgi:hypothetical protein